MTASQLKAVNGFRWTQPAASALGSAGPSHRVWGMLDTTASNLSVGTFRMHASKWALLCWEGWAGLGSSGGETRSAPCPWQLPSTPSPRQQARGQQARRWRPSPPPRCPTSHHGTPHHHLWGPLEPRDPSALGLGCLRPAPLCGLGCHCYKGR